jgi:hypothetical protein
MELLFNIIIISIFLSSYSCVNSLTYVFSYTNASEINSLLRSNDLILTNTTFVQRLSSSNNALLTSTQTLLSNATNIQSIVFIWYSDDCSYPTALATYYPTKYIGTPICFSQTFLLNNLLQLSVTTNQLAGAAISFLNQYSLHYFTMILTGSNDLYSNLAQQFSSYLTEKSYIFEQIIFVSNFSSPSSISSLKSRG